MWNHSQRVADFAVAIGRTLGLDQERLTTLRRAALVHDLGKAALPDRILVKQDSLSESEWEQFRLHPYYTERLLARVEQFHALIPEATAHHERLDGQGYHRRLAGDEITLGGRILAVPDVYEGLSRGMEQEDPQAILERMRSLVGPHLDVDCFEALAASLGQAKPPVKRGTGSRPTQTVSGREVEVLRELAKGQTNKQIAKVLFISENTVERHLDNIYSKLGVSSRTSAVVWAVQEGLVS
jgi:HD-GYP domain-containing protein (c-di-GMP phosphodiesterase class II)